MCYPDRIVPLLALVSACLIDITSIMTISCPIGFMKAAKVGKYELLLDLFLERMMAKIDIPNGKVN